MLFTLRTLMLFCVLKGTMGLGSCPKQMLSHDQKTVSQPVYPQTLSPETLANRYPPLMVLVSFSMPLNSLKDLGDSLKKIGGKLVFRGLYNNSFKDMAHKLKDLGHEALIDPTVFETFKVTQVPVFLLLTPPKSKIQGNIFQGKTFQGNTFQESLHQGSMLQSKTLQDEILQGDTLQGHTLSGHITVKGALEIFNKHPVREAHVLLKKLTALHTPKGLS